MIVFQNYAAFADTTKLPTYWDALKTMKLALMKTEQWDIVAAGGDRYELKPYFI